MSDFNSFARELDKAFKETRGRYDAAAAELKAAEEEYNRSQAWFQEKRYGERQRKMQLGKYAWEDAQEKFKESTKNLWPDFYRKSVEIRSRLAAAVDKANGANPTDLDMATVELLKSGILTASDFERLFNQFDGNRTMIRFIGQYAGEMALKLTKDSEYGDRVKLTKISYDAQRGYNDILRAFDDLERAARTLSGNYLEEGRQVYIGSAAARWEEVTSAAIENF